MKTYAKRPLNRFRVEIRAVSVYCSYAARSYNELVQSGLLGASWSRTFHTYAHKSILGSNNVSNKRWCSNAGFDKNCNKQLSTRSGPRKGAAIGCSIWLPAFATPLLSRLRPGLRLCTFFQFTAVTVTYCTPGSLNGLVCISKLPLFILKRARAHLHTETERHHEQSAAGIQWGATSAPAGIQP